MLGDAEAVDHGRDAAINADLQQDLGTYGYAADLQATDEGGLLDLLTLEYLADAGACVLGTPDQCIEMCKRYEAAGVPVVSWTDGEALDAVLEEVRAYRRYARPARA